MLVSGTLSEQPVMWSLPVNAAGITNTGLREENQDRMTSFFSPYGWVYLVADGMGGHKGGAEAAELVAGGFEQRLLAPTEELSLQSALQETVLEVHRELRRRSSTEARFAGMGSTVAIAVVQETGAGLSLITAHMGDSRVYLHRGGQLILLTKDHTQVQWLVDTRAVDEATARSHPDASILTRAVGHGTDPALDISEPIALRNLDGILLCSDGLSGFADGRDIDRAVKRYPNPQDCVKELLQTALGHGSNDNITIQFIRIGDNPQPVEEQPVRSYITKPETAKLVHAPSPAGFPPRAPQKPFQKRLAAALFFLLPIGLMGTGILALRSGWLDSVLQGKTADPLQMRINQLKKRADKLEEAARKSSQSAEGDLQKLAALKATMKRRNYSTLKADLEGTKAELDRIARTGRSSGSHVVLATSVSGMGKTAPQTTKAKGKAISTNPVAPASLLDREEKIIAQAELDLKASQDRLALLEHKLPTPVTSDSGSKE